MSVKVIDQVWDYSAARGAARLVLVALADWAGHDGFCYPSLSAIAHRTKLTKSAVIVNLKRLAEMGELEVTVRGHDQFDPVRDNPNKDGGWQPTNYYRVTLAKVVNETDRPRKRTGSPSHAQGSPRREQGGPSDAVAYKEEPLVDPLEEPSEGKTAPPPSRTPNGDVLEDFRIAWNEAAMTAQPPLPPCESLTRTRRRLIRACLVERPITAWREIFARVARSRFLTANERGWPASLDWLIATPDPALKVLEGQYDDRPIARPRPGQTPAYSEWICPHVTPCANRSACASATLLGRPERMAS